MKGCTERPEREHQFGHSLRCRRIAGAFPPYFRCVLIAEPFASTVVTRRCILEPAHGVSARREECAPAFASAPPGQSERAPDDLRRGGPPPGPPQAYLPSGTARPPGASRRRRVAILSPPRSCAGPASASRRTEEPPEAGDGPVQVRARSRFSSAARGQRGHRGRAPALAPEGRLGRVGWASFRPIEARPWIFFAAARCSRRAVTGTPSPVHWTARDWRSSTSSTGRSDWRCGPGVRMRGLRQLGRWRLASRPETAGIRAHFDVEARRQGLDPRLLHTRAMLLPSHRKWCAPWREARPTSGWPRRRGLTRSGLDCIPLCRESYGLLVRASLLGDPRVVRLCEVAQSPAFRRDLGAVPGYDAGARGGHFLSASDENSPS